MNKSGPVIIIEDDIDEQEMLNEVFKELKYENEILYFNDGLAALEYIISTPVEPFIVLSDVGMPMMNGMELREKIHSNDNLRLKCLPYLFFSGTAVQKHVVEAYSKSVQGFFVKPVNYENLKSTIRKIMEYWQECISPEYVKPGNKESMLMNFDNQ